MCSYTNELDGYDDDNDKRWPMEKGCNSDDECGICVYAVAAAAAADDDDDDDVSEHATDWNCSAASAASVTVAFAAADRY